jgi:hypothetical protein
MADDHEPIPLTTFNASAVGVASTSSSPALSSLSHPATLLSNLSQQSPTTAQDAISIDSVPLPPSSSLPPSLSLSPTQLSRQNSSSDSRPESSKTLPYWFNGTNVALTIFTVVAAYLGIVYARDSTSLAEWTSKKDYMEYCASQVNLPE